MRADLHLHTIASDGSLTPEELVALAAGEEFDVIAVSDHDSIDGVAAAKAAGKRLGVRVIPGVELSCGAANARCIAHYHNGKHGRNGKKRRSVAIQNTAGKGSSANHGRVGAGHAAATEGKTYKIKPFSVFR